MSIPQIKFTQFKIRK